MIARIDYVLIQLGKHEFLGQSFHLSFNIRLKVGAR